MNTPLLDGLRNPAAVKALSVSQMEDLAREIRSRIIQTVSVNGGHFGGPMGVVELAVALHHVFDFPADRLIWDVGHQCYPHKLLTGRADRFHTLRTEGGISGYPAPDESPHDLFTTAHAGTAASSAVGLAVGDTLMGRKSRVVAVVGDGAMSSGVAYEALNHAGTLKRQFLVILNDNNLSIDRGTGALADLLDRFRCAPAYHEFKKAARHLLSQIPLIGQSVTDALSALKGGIRGALAPHHVFEPLGFRYIGPVDGHDIGHLIPLLREVADHPGPVLLHVHTQKGRGFDVADVDPLGFHALTPFEIDDGRVRRKPSTAGHKSFTEVFGDVLTAAGETRADVVAITAAMPDGTGLLKFRERFPQRTVDVAICEQHAVGFAAALAKSGVKPVAAIYSTFLQRAFDQVFHEVSLQNLPVVIAMDRGGLVGADGPTHHGLADIAYLRIWPHFVVCAPADAGEMQACLDFALDAGRPVAFRYPRDEALPDWRAAAGGPLPAGPPPAFELGRSVTLRKGADAMLLGYGVMAVEAVRAAELLAARGWDAGVVNARFAKPLDEAMLRDALTTSRLVVTVEDHWLTGGFGSAVLEAAGGMAGIKAPVLRIGIADRFVPHATRRRQLEMCGLTAPQIADRVEQELRRHGVAPSRPAAFPTPSPAGDRAVPPPSGRTVVPVASGAGNGNGNGHATSEPADTAPSVQGDPPSATRRALRFEA